MRFPTEVGRGDTVLAVPWRRPVRCASLSSYLVQVIEEIFIVPASRTSVNLLVGC